MISPKGKAKKHSLIQHEPHSRKEVILDACPWNFSPGWSDTHALNNKSINDKFARFHKEQDEDSLADPDVPSWGKNRVASTCYKQLKEILKPGRDHIPPYPTLDIR